LAERPNERPAQPDAQAPIAVVNALAPTEIRPLAEGGTTPTAEGTAAPADEEELGRISNLFRVSEIRPRLLRLGHRPGAMSEEAASGRYDLVVLGAENRAIQHRLFFGHENERLIAQSKVTVAIVVPNMVALSKEDPSAISALQRPRATPFEGAPRTTS
jgi:nucleotide-binding universal stress UspA family protein